MASVVRRMHGVGCKPSGWGSNSWFATPSGPLPPAHLCKTLHDWQNQPKDLLGGCGVVYSDDAIKIKWMHLFALAIQFLGQLDLHGRRTMVIIGCVSSNPLLQTSCFLLTCQQRLAGMQIPGNASLTRAGGIVCTTSLQPFSWSRMGLTYARAHAGASLLNLCTCTCCKLPFSSPTHRNGHFDG